MAEGADSMMAVVDSMVVAEDFTAEGMGSTAMDLRTGAIATTGIMETGTMEIGAMATTGITGTTGTGTMDIGAGAAGGIRGTAILPGITQIMALTTIRPTIIRTGVTTAAITAEQITETAIPTVQK
jgi:hypothetical protein